MVVLGYVLGYLLVAFILAKLSFVVITKIKQGESYSVSTLKEHCVGFGIAWIFSVPLAAFFLIMWIIVFGLIEGGKKLL